MRITFQSKNIQIPKPQEALIAEKIRFTFERLAEHVSSISVYIADVNGPKGGKDKSCRLHIRPVNGKEIVVTGIYDQVFEAIDKNCTRGKQALANQIKKTSSVRRKFIAANKELMSTELYAPTNFN